MEHKEIIKQQKIIELLNELEDWKLKLLSEDNPDMSKLSKGDYYILLECCWVELEREEGTEKEIKEAMGGIIVLCTLEGFRRKGLVFINKKGNYDKTTIGKEVYKELIKRKKQKHDVNCVEGENDK